MRPIHCIALGCLVFLAARPAAAFDEFANQRSPTHFKLTADSLTLALKGELELEFHDIEGQGGPGHDSPTDTKTLGTRSPFVEIDSFWLALRLGLGGQVGFYSVLDFRPDRAAIQAAWLDYRTRGPARLEHHLEAGYHTPMVATDRRTERYPLVATAFWREPELHLTYDATIALAPRCRLVAGLSLAMMRPLALSGVQESTSQQGTINILALGPARSFSGNGPVGGGQVGISLWGAFVEAWAFVGRLSAEAGTDVLRSALPNYRHLPAAAARDFARAGGRVGYEGHGLHAWLEGSLGRTGALDRYGAYAQLSWEIPILHNEDWLRTMEPLVRVETLRIVDAAHLYAGGAALRSTAPINAASWDYDVLTMALITRLYQDLVTVRAEYYLVRETNGVPGLGVPDEPFANNEFMLQAELRF